MKVLVPALAALFLTGCGTNSEDPASEAAIANAAAKLERQADANVNRAIAEIEALSQGVADDQGSDTLANTAQSAKDGN
jgi:outer membrane biogenesis lipoprotein LolB